MVAMLEDLHGLGLVPVVDLFTLVTFTRHSQDLDCDEIRQIEQVVDVVDDTGR